MRKTIRLVLPPIDYDLLQDQKIHLRWLAYPNEGMPGRSDPDDSLAEGLIELIDSILDNAQSNGLWDYDTWKKSRGIPEE